MVSAWIGSGQSGHQLKNTLKVQPFAYCGDDFLEQGYLLVRQEEFVF